MDKKIIEMSLKSANKHIEKARTDSMTAIMSMVGNKSHKFKEEKLINFEHESAGLIVEKIDKDKITLSDKTTIDLGELETDDLNSLAGTLYEEKYF